MNVYRALTTTERFVPFHLRRDGPLLPDKLQNALGAAETCCHLTTERVDPLHCALGWPVIAAATVTTAAFMFLVLGLALKARRRPVVTGIEEMIGSTGHVVDWSGDRGRIHVHGETWQARVAPPRSPPPAGAKVRIVALDGLTAVVEPDKAPEPARR